MPETRKLREAMDAAQQAKPMQEVLMLKCYGTHSENGQHKRETELGMLLNFNTRLAFVGGIAMLDIVQVVDSQIVLKSQDGSGID